MAYWMDLQFLPEWIRIGHSYVNYVLEFAGVMGMFLCGLFLYFGHLKFSSLSKPITLKMHLQPALRKTVGIYCIFGSLCNLSALLRWVWKHGITTEHNIDDFLWLFSELDGPLIFCGFAFLIILHIRTTKKR